MSVASSVSSFLPGVWPVVQRELRARARKSRYYWMRVLGGVGAMLIVSRLLSLNVDSPSDAAAQAFSGLDLLLLTLIIIAVPAMTSDCLSREKREGTLGLLFLTPLTPAGIVIGKCATQAVLAWSLWLSVLPAMAIPFLLGGLTWHNLIIATLFQFCAVIICLAAGLLASCLTQRRNLSLFYAAVLTYFFISCVFVFMFAFGTIATTAQPSWLDKLYYAWSMFEDRGLLAITSDGFGAVVSIQTNQIPTTLPVASMLIGISALAFAILVGSIWLAARHIRKNWSDKPPTARQRWWSQHFCTVLFRNAFRRTMQHSLDKHPIAWLQQYSWKARITKWGLCLLFVLIELYSLVSHNIYGQPMRSQHFFLLLILMGVGTVAGVGSFRYEKECGALELILISPLSVNEIIFGRVLGWWNQFLPAALMLLFFAAATEWATRPDFFQAVPISVPISNILWTYSFAAIAYLSLPFFAVYAALRVKYFIIAVILAWIGIGLEFAFGAALAGLLNGYSGERTALIFFCTLVSSAVFVRLTFFLLRHSLSRRIYSF